MLMFQRDRGLVRITVMKNLMLLQATLLSQAYSNGLRIYVKIVLSER